MISQTLRAGTLALAMAGALSAAHAAPVTYTFSATVDHVTSDGDNHTTGDLAGLHVELGDKVIGSFTYDPAAATSTWGPQPSGPGATESYLLPGFSFDYTFLSGRNSYAGSTTAGAQVFNDSPNDSVNFTVVAPRTLQGIDLMSLTALVFGDAPGTLWNSTSVPGVFDTSLPGKYANLIGGVSANDGSGFFNFSASMTSLQLSSVSAVPEPGVNLMLLAGLGAIGVAARRRQRAA